jgi:hypothetical protein
MKKLIFILLMCVSSNVFASNDVATYWECTMEGSLGSSKPITIYEDSDTIARVQFRGKFFNATSFTHGFIKLWHWVEGDTDFYIFLHPNNRAQYYGVPFSRKDEPFEDMPYTAFYCNETLKAGKNTRRRAD